MVIYLLFAVMGFVLNTAYGHETPEFKHLTESSGPIIWQDMCPMGISLWGIDHDLDGSIDVCKGIILVHGVIHIALFKTTIEDSKVVCSCELLSVNNNM
jgi:hypothetical protein